MKHRSLVIFIIIVATLAVAPETAQHLAQLKETAAERTLRGISDAFLALYAQKLKGQSAPFEETASATETAEAAPDAKQKMEAVIIAANQRTKPAACRKEENRSEATRAATAEKLELATDNHFILLERGVAALPTAPASSRGARQAADSRRELPQFVELAKNAREEDLNEVMKKVESARTFGPRAFPSEKEWAVVMTRFAAQRQREAELKRESHRSRARAAVEVQHFGEGDEDGPQSKEHKAKERIKVSVPMNLPDPPPPAAASALGAVMGF